MPTGFTPCWPLLEVQSKDLTGLGLTTFVFDILSMILITVIDLFRNFSQASAWPCFDSVCTYMRGYTEQGPSLCVWMKQRQWVTRMQLTRHYMWCGSPRNWINSWRGCLVVYSCSRICEPVSWLWRQVPLYFFLWCYRMNMLCRKYESCNQALIELRLVTF